jgi:hypothetical protein
MLLILNLPYNTHSSLIVWFSENIVPLWVAMRCFFVIFMVFHMSISLLILLFVLSVQSLTGINSKNSSVSNKHSLMA